MRCMCLFKKKKRESFLHNYYYYFNTKFKFSKYFCVQYFEVTISYHQKPTESNKHSHIYCEHKARFGYFVADKRKWICVQSVTKANHMFV